MPQWLRDELPPPKRRERLPPPAQQARPTGSDFKWPYGLCARCLQSAMSCASCAGRMLTACAQLVVLCLP